MNSSRSYPENQLGDMRLEIDIRYSFRLRKPDISFR